MKGRRRQAAWALVLAALLGLDACAAQTRYRVLSFFFDGVPPPRGEVPPKAPPPPVAVAQPTPSPAPPAVRYVTHRPYADGQCSRCHAPFSRRVVRSPEEGLCAQCHRVPDPKLPFAHGPAAAQSCLACHDPHYTRTEHLLRDTGRALCLQCHEEEDLGDVTGHRGGEACLACHFGHGGRHRFFLRRGG